MGKRGPQKKKLSVLKPNIKRPLPPVGMTEKSRTIWMRVTSSLPADFFKPHHHDQLRIYCEFASMNKIATAKLASEEYLDLHWLTVADKSAARVQQYATKLGITVNNTLAARGKAGEAPAAKSKREGLLYGTKNR